MSKKLFAVSDIHGHYTELMRALADAGFDENNEDHIFLSCGDLFDRGKENTEVYDFVRRLDRKILIKGNHEDMLCEILASGETTERETGNGTYITLRQMLGESSVDANGHIDTVLYAEKIKEINEFVASMYDYYEVGEYIFTHGWLPIVFEGRYPSVDKNWRNASREAWDYAHTLEWHQLYDVKALLDGKIIVCGHRPSWLGYMFDEMRENDCCDIFFGNGMIAIDAGTVRYGRVNVFVLDI